jgi:hypothetical protein
MRFALLVALAVVLVSSARAVDFGAPPPHPIAGSADIELVAGELSSPRLTAGHRVSLDPARGAHLTVRRYRVRTREGEASPTEKFVWNELPSRRAPLRCFEWVGPSGGGAWREISPGGVAYESEMATLRLVLAEQNRHYRNQIRQAAER